MDYQNIIVEVKEQVLFLTINRPDKLNALNKQTLAELSDAIAKADNDPVVRGILITGSGPKAFVAGADISEFADYDGARGEELARSGQEAVFNTIERCSKPVIAAINGFALGGGLELAMACHMRIAADHAKMGLPETTLGLIPGYGGTQRLTQLVGKGRAIEMIATADMITADVAEKIGLVNYVVPQDELMNKAESLFGRIKQRAPLAVSGALRAVNAAGSAEGYETEIREFGKCFETGDFKEGVSAFLEKRAPNFDGK